MHYYKRNIGDYHKKAGRCSMLQHGAYTLLKDACYDREAFPASEEEAFEWTWASTPEEEAAVRFILGRFFKFEDGHYVQKRIAEELARYQENRETNARIAKEREAKKRAAREERERSEHEACDDDHEACENQHESAPNHKPLTSNQEPGTNPYPAEFEIAWSTYPKREGSNPKKKAFHAWNARRKSGVEIKDIQAGIDRYRVYCQVRGKLHTRFVMTAATFFGPDEHFRETWEINDHERYQGHAAGGSTTGANADAAARRRAELAGEQTTPTS